MLLVHPDPPERRRNVCACAALLGSLLWVCVGCGSQLQAAAAHPTATQVAAADRLDFLRAEVKRHDELYHGHAAPEISDAEYDDLKRELLALEAVAKTPAQPAPTGFSTDDHAPGFKLYPHLQRMLSLEKAYSDTDLRRFDERLVRRVGRAVRYVIEPKYDGIAVNVQYESGNLIRVLTRGDGRHGDDITQNALRYASIPKKLIRSIDQELPSNIEIRGEIFMSLVEFESARRAREDAGQPTYASPRNLAAGTLKSQQGYSAFVHRLQVVFYGVGAVQPAEFNVKTQEQLLSQLQTWGLPVADHVHYADSATDMLAAVKQMTLSRYHWAFPADGVVVKLDSRADQALIGDSNEAPRWAIAYKFAPNRGATRLKGITLQVGRTGLITPVAELEPIRLDGALITRASLHNADEIARRDLRIGDYVIVERGGEVIPAVVEVDLTRRNHSSSPYLFPQACPACAANLVRRERQVAWRCPNIECSAQIKRRLLHFASRSGVGISGLGEATIDRLVDAGKLKNVSDIYRLKREDLLAIAADKSVNALLAAIHHSKSAELSRVIHGLGIQGVGRRSAETLAAAFPSLPDLMAAEVEDLVQVDGISRDSAINLVEFFETEDLSLLAEDPIAGRSAAP